MNKIYKVIWSKVKHQYVVVSELAHSNGKQSRTSRNSIRSRIAALVVCGAIAAFGVFSALPMDSAYAADVNVQQATQTQYVAFRADTTSDEWRKGEKTIEGIVFRPQTIRLSDKTLNYWVREGYTLKATEGIQYIPDNLMKTDDVNGHKSDYAISAEITDQNLIKGSVLKTTESSAVGTTAMTTRNESLQKIEVGHYTGVSNSGGVGTGTIDWNYIIDPNGQGNVNEFIDIKDAAPDQWDPSQGKYVKDVWKSGYLKEVELRGSSYYLKDTNQEVASQNVYIIGDKAGAFVTTKNGSEIYTGRVYGAHNEILMTGKDENGNYYTYWAGKVNDDDNVLLSDSNLTLGDYKENVNAFYRNDKKLAAADIKSVEVDANNNGINLITNTQFDENGKPIERTEETITGFTVTSVKNIGEDTKIQFSDGENNKFDVDAGSRVVATKDEDGKVSELSINGTKYAIGGGETYTAGDGIAIATDDNNKISVNAGDGLTFETQEGEDKGKLKVNVGDGLSITNGEVVNNFKVEADKNAADGSDDNWTITDGQQKFTNTTLVNGTVEKRAIQDNAYGSDYLVKDTDGNTATLKDVASATKLQSIDTTKIGNLKYSAVDIEDNTIKDTDTVTTAIGKLDSAVDKAATEAGKHTSVSVGDNLGINETPNGNGGTNYKVTLDDTLYLGGNHTEGDSKITLDGATGTAIIGNSTSGKATIGGVNITTTTTGESTSSTIGGLTNKTWNATENYSMSGQAATEAQLQAATELAVQYDSEDKKSVTLGGLNSEGNRNISYTYNKENPQESGGVRLTNVAYATGKDGSEAVNVDYLEDTVDSINNSAYKGWTVSANGETNKVVVPSNGNVDFSNTDGNIIVGQTGTNLTFDLNDNITLGDESGTRIQLNGNPQKDSMISITNKDSDTVFNIAKDGTVLSDGDIVAKADSNKKYSLSEVGENAVRYNNEDKSTVALAGTSGTTITNVADGALNKESTEAVNGSQLYAVDQKVDAGWTAKDSKGNIIAVNPTETGTTTLNFAGDNNITVTADTTNKAIQVALNDKVYLGGDHTEDSRNIVLDGERGVIGLGSNIALDGRDGTAVIGGVNITTTAEEGTGKPVSTINGLSNTTWTGTTETPNRAATEGQLEDLSDTVNTGWYVADKDTAEDSTTGNFAVKPGETLTFNGDDNIDVEAKDHKVNVSLKDNITLGEGNSQININGNPENGEAALSIGDKFVVEQNGTTTIVADDGINNRPSQAQLTPDTTVTIAPSGVTFAGDDKGTTIIEGQKITSGGIVINGEDIYDKTTGIVTKGTITGLSNTTWDGKTDNASRVATEGQLKAVSDDVNAGWIATDSQNHEVNITPDNNKLNFAGDENVTVTAANNEIKVALNDDIVLGDYLNGDDGVLIGGSSGTISATNSITVGEDQGLIIDGQKKEIQGLSNTTWNEDVANAVERDSVAASTAATQGQLQEVSKVANAGWNASDGTNSISVKPNETLNFVGDENLTVSADGTDKKLKVSLNDNITLGDGQSAITLNGSPQNSDDPALSVGTDKFVVAQDGSLSVSDKFNVDAETGNIYAANNSGSAIMMNDDSVALNAGGNGIVASDEGILLNTNGINEDIKLVTKGTSVSVDSNGTTFTNTNTNETTNINGGTINVGDKLMVEEDGSIYATNNNGSTVMINDNGVALNSEGNGVVVSGEGITLNTNGSAVTVDRFNGTTFTNTNTGETTNINGGTITTNTVKGLSNTTWDDELAKQVANSEELQGTAATQGQLQQAVSEVAEVANAGWNAKAGGNTINVKPNETLNFEGDGNITVSATGGTSNELKFGLNDDITLGNPKAGNTEGERSFTINTTNPEGYVPESYKTGSGADFIDENGGFMLFATNTQGYGVFGVTAKGSAWAKDFKTYTTDIYGNNTQYSLNDVGDAVAQMSSYYNKENGKSYTVFSRYLNEAEKDNPFATVDENATRDIPLALRDDGAVLIGATIKGDDFTDNGIRINAETETTYDGDGNEVTNNIATITGLENTEWKPPTPVATFAANDINTTSRAATEAQLDDLYSAVAAYDVNVDGTIDYSHIALAGAPYGASRAGNGTPTGGTSITNVAYASGKDGSEAVNVDYLNDAISDAAENGSISTSDQHLVANTETGSNGVYKPNDDGNVNLIVSDEKGNSSTITIGDVASKEDLDNLKDDVGDLDYSKVEGDTIIDGDSVTDAIGKLDNKIENISGTATDADNNTVTGGKINSDGTISLTQKDKDSIKLEGQLTDSGVVQEGTSFDKETGTITITSQDKYSGETSSVKVEGIASTEVVGATNKEDLATAYKDADKDGNATTEYITDSESMVEADVALDHAIQDVANTSYANDMVLSNRIDSVEKRLGNVEERIDKVGAMAAAIANLRTMGFDPEAPTEIAIGVGQYKSETGIAIGVFHYPNQDFMLSASLSSSGDELMGGIGATWKLGRKSAAERAKDEEARHLEQAEEMKKLAQQEKVKAQAQRHAKLLAERQQASQKNA